MASPIALHGWTAQPRDLSILLSSKDNISAPKPTKVAELPLPDTKLAKELMDYAKKELREETFNHSMRVYYYGMVIQIQQFPDWQLSDETYLLTCVLHDIGTTDKNISATLMSFEYFGGLLALDLLHKQLHAPLEQAGAVTEAITRHQDIGNSGKITILGQLIQLATIFDNMGANADLVHRDTIEDVVTHYPRKKWSSCFAATTREEIRLKPWAHTTALGEEDFPNGVLGNELMAPYEE